MNNIELHVGPEQPQQPHQEALGHPLHGGRKDQLGGTATARQRERQRGHKLAARRCATYFTGFTGFQARVAGLLNVKLSEPALRVPEH